MNIEESGKKINSIPVKISYRIIELFSAGLYSSPNKAFEELVCNSYDAYADLVAVYVPSDLTVNDAYIWVCDNGESMDQDELKRLWKVGEPKKRKQPEGKNDRLQIGRFGIGKLATYILANELTYICKKDGKFIATKMDYSRISDDIENLSLDEIELSEEKTKEIIEPLISKNEINLISFKLFGKDACNNWTFSVLTNLKAKVSEIKEGRLKWVLKTALPLNPNFKLCYNGSELKSSKINKPILKTWVIGKDDATAEKIDGCETVEKNEKHYIDFPNLKGVYGQIDLYEDSLLEGKSGDLGRSHGIFLMVRARLINLDDPLLGLEAFAHGAFNRTRIVIHADELDENLTSTREAIKESTPYNQLKNYIKKKFNNEVKKYFFDQEKKELQESSLSYRISKTPLTLSKTPLIIFAEKFINNEIHNPFLIDITSYSIEDAKKLKTDLYEEKLLKDDPQWDILPGDYPIAKFDLKSRTLRINLMHPFIANYSDKIKSKLPIEFIAISEILTEAYLYEIGIDEADISLIMHRRDRTLRELVFSDRSSAPLVARMVKDALSDSTGLEEAVYKVFLTLGYEATKIGGNGKPDGKANAILGYSEADKCENYSLTYDTKSTGGKKIKANTSQLATINKHKNDYKADYAIVVAIGYEGEDDPTSNISIMAKQQRVTVMKAIDLMRLLLLSVPQQIGLKKIRDLLETCHTPREVGNWINDIEQKKVDKRPLRELLETVFELQKNDTEPPELASVRIKLNEKTNERYSKTAIKEWVNSLKTFVPGFISIEGERLGLNTKPDVIIQAMNDATPSVPTDLQKMYIDAFCVGESD